jgi:D-3-phosphoglycerate dehydrogenase
MAFFRYSDRPGVIGIMGRLLGDAGVNIAGMQVGRDHEGGAAVVALTVDSAIPPAVLAEIAEEIGAQIARAVDLSDDPPG